MRAFYLAGPFAAPLDGSALRCPPKMALRPQYAVVGQPIAHSLSPRLFAGLFRKVGVEADYVAQETGPGEEAALVRAVREGRYAGVSVTLPLKESVLSHVDRVDGVAHDVGAANCLVRDEAASRVLAYNTDVVGVERALSRFGVSLRGKRILILGAGGAARAASCVARAAVCAELWIANRTLPRAKELLRGWTGGGQAIDLRAPEFGDILAASDVVIHATQVGLSNPAACILPPRLLPPRGACVMDMVYRPVRTMLLGLSESAGALPVDGLWMLVYQALEQLRLWTGVELGDEVAAELHDNLIQEAAK
ncbi:MAG: shikimate dehydrogenase family protein [Myxococcaceae bacterium]